jgi:hypothetical protein
MNTNEELRSLHSLRLSVSAAKIFAEKQEARRSQSKFEIANLKFEISNFESQISNLESQIPKFKSKI